MTVPHPTSPLSPRQRELFNAILSDFLAHGFDTFTIDEATRRYHCSKSTLYTLGKSRDEIVRRIIVSFFKEITRRTTPPKSITSYCTALENYFSAITTALEPASPAFMRDLAREPVAQEVYSLNTAAATSIITSLLEGGLEAGEFEMRSAPFFAQVIQHVMTDIQMGTYTSTLDPASSYHELGQLILRGITVEK